MLLKVGNLYSSFPSWNIILDVRISIIHGVLVHTYDVVNDLQLKVAFVGSIIKFSKSFC